MKPSIREKLALNVAKIQREEADDINDIFDNMGDYYEQKINKENH